MEKERRKKLQTTKLIITEVFMLVMIVVLVVVLTFVVMGYQLKDDGTIERAGLVQIESIPSGATVEINGEIEAAKTNTSKMLPEGEYKISVSKEGYIGWEKKASVKSGLLTRLNYPRLIKEKRETSEVEELSGEVSFFSAALNRESILYGLKDSRVWHWMNIKGNDAQNKDINLEAILKKDDVVENVTWNNNNNTVLAKVKRDGGVVFIYVVLDKPENSLDLNKEFGLSVQNATFFNDSGLQLAVIEDGHLRIVTANNKQISKVIGENVESFYAYKSNVIFVSKDEDGFKYIKLYHDGDEEALTVKESIADEIRVAISEYMGTSWMIYSEGNNLNIYKGELPSRLSVSEENYGMELYKQRILEAGTPKVILVGSRNQAIILSYGKKKSVLDIETGMFTDFELENEASFYVDDFLVGVIHEGKLVIRDFDGENKRVLGSNYVSGAVIASNEKWLYYVSKNDGGKEMIVRDNLK